MSQLQGKVAIVTGGGSGFGEGIVKLYAKEGAKVVIADINKDAADRVAREVGSAALAIKADVSSRADIDNTVRACRESFGSVDIVVNNAAITHKNQPMLEVDEAMFDRMFDINVKSIYHMAQAVVPVMREQKRGVILNVGSTAGIRPRPGLSWYNASKGAVNVLSKSMAVELGPDGIRVNAICPVMGITGMFELFMGLPDTPENRAKFVSTIPLGRFCQPSDVAAAALFLASDAAEFITGVEFPVDGGRTV
ncbi:glucose 1-dehydrogenase [Achromobacter denitrificans]|uniref:glucose 1-dehydrogenase n=1 Tax=Achromobacter denitrificans TaxID=32002 RepID=UPI0023E789F0|nr:glucose 1-dehydrogenase [Achromobacter denitrificans]MDX3876880.1 glucose 1-dehydrogenase [Achromobacter sp.]MBV2159634.1 glucose 1-dehydrogenase [Achromobacter denitrificans]MDF3847294.1 glucose 1-dehydrogenase [Achromobacter denitrificans]MDF3940982.1 glucose 1-dehydrogenase [Achromobacter denitrificans]WFC68983.1 glucose 1-dehydrogenase [Achromobacter denitrificans]